MRPRSARWCRAMLRAAGSSFSCAAPRLSPPPTTLRVNEKLATLYVTELAPARAKHWASTASRASSHAAAPRDFPGHRRGDRLAPASSSRSPRSTRALKALEAERIREGKALRRDFDRLESTTSPRQCPKSKGWRTHSRTEIRGEFPDAGARVLAECRSTKSGSTRRPPGRPARRYHRGSDPPADPSEALSELLERAGPVGKSIEFLLQEINREVNTMGSKSQNAALSQLTVELKGEVEKMREQVQNVE